jgi:hypothetical protein
MVATAIQRRLSLRVSDVSRQKLVQVEDLSPDTSVGELVQGLLGGGMKLPQTDSEGRPVVYHARLDREGRHLHGSELVGEALRNEDLIILLPHITAG